METNYWPRTALVFALAAVLSGCQVFGMARAVRITGETFDEAECLARDFRGEEPCPNTAQQVQAEQRSALERGGNYIYQTGKH